MKNTLKRLLVYSLALAISICQLPSAFASSHCSEKEIAANYLREHGIMVGDETGCMHLDRSLTRAELAVLLTQIAGNVDHVVTDQQYYVSRCKFPDVPAWAKLYVGYCYCTGFVAGYENGSYGSSDTVTPSAASTVLLRYLEIPADTWTYTTACEKATELGLCDADVLNSPEIDRGTMALMIYRALTIQEDELRSTNDPPPSIDCNLVTLPTDGSLYVPSAGDKLLCDDDTLYEIKDMSRYDSNVFASGSIGELPTATCNWDLFPELTLPDVDVRHYSNSAGDTLFIRNLYETRRMQYTIYNALGNEPSAWHGDNPLATVELSIPVDLELYTEAFWPWRAAELTDLVHSRPNSRYYVEAWDYFLNGVFQYTRYCVVSQ